MIEIYTTPWCPFCVRAKNLLDEKGASYQETDVSREPALREQMRQRSGRYTVPQIWIHGQHIGGCDDLYALQRNGKLDALLTTITGENQ